MIMVCLFRRREETPLSRAAVQAGDRAHLPAQSTRQFLGSVPVNHFNLIYTTRSPLLGSFTGLLLTNALVTSNDFERVRVGRSKCNQRRILYVCFLVGYLERRSKNATHAGAKLISVAPFRRASRTLSATNSAVCAGGRFRRTASKSGTTAARRPRALSANFVIVM